MIRHKSRWLLVGLVCLALWPAEAHGQSPALDEAYSRFVDLYSQGHYEEALAFAEEAVKLSEQEFGPDHPDVAVRLNGLAEVYRAEGRYDDAERLHKQALAIREKALGPEHPDVAQSLNNLAEVYRAQGRHTEAQFLLDRAQALEARGAAQSGRRESYMAAGVAAYQLGHYAEAQGQLEAALRTAEEAFGTQDRLAQSLNRLATLYQAQGKHAEAEPLFKQALAIWEKAVGPDHPNVATILNNLAEVYRAQGKYDEAEPLQKRALTIREKVLGPEHPDVAQILENYAALLRKTGRSAEANKMEARAKAIRAKSE